MPDKQPASERFPRSSRYPPEWVTSSVSGGANSLWLAEWLAEALDFLGHIPQHGLKPKPWHIPALVFPKISGVAWFLPEGIQKTPTIQRGLINAILIGDGR